jgi:hypothetical protein
MNGFIRPSTAEFRSSPGLDSMIIADFFPATTTIKSARVEVRDAMVSIGSISSSPRLILNAVGTVDQKRMAKPA